MSAFVLPVLNSNTYITLSLLKAMLKLPTSSPVTSVFSITGGTSSTLLDTSIQLRSAGLQRNHMSMFPRRSSLPASQRKCVSYKPMQIISWLFPFMATHLLFPTSFDTKRQIPSNSHQKPKGCSVSPILGFGFPIFQQKVGKNSLVFNLVLCETNHFQHHWWNQLCRPNGQIGTNYSVVVLFVICPCHNCAKHTTETPIPALRGLCCKLDMFCIV